MTAYQVYEQAIKPLSAQEKPAPEPSIKRSEQTTRYPSRFGCGRDLLAGIDIDELLAVLIDDMFADYMLEESDTVHY